MCSSHNLEIPNAYNPHLCLAGKSQPQLWHLRRPSARVHARRRGTVLRSRTVWHPADAGSHQEKLNSPHRFGNRFGFQGGFIF